MISKLIQKSILNKHKLFALLIDPDKHTTESLSKLSENANTSNVDLIFVGGSLLNKDINKSFEIIKANSAIPTLLFPGNLLQLTNKADGILLLSLISGRNPDLLIGNHVIASTQIKNSNLEVLPTGYILLEGGKTSSVEYMSNTKPIPAEKTDIAIATALAGEMLGLKYIYLEAGSGAKLSINTNIIKSVKNNISIPLIVGGGIKTSNDIRNTLDAGADIVVIGNIIEQKPEILHELVTTVHQF
ncbi:MAG: geranylgeranylglyceryl/heptaprenylglyceryl phosphate synthase [Bacteroidales bacterium]|jgi:phosphoglycerol geranylgeranyltransferase|nr:geranylgeranylglyceryl/heptaprenylglyceryl phosphate synthase [Bacteroidales bacterium]